MARWDRRNVLRAGAAVLGGAGAGWTASGALASSETMTDPTGATPIHIAPPAGAEVEPFHGAHQAGIATAPQAHLALIGFDLAGHVDRRALARLMRLLTDDAARLSSGVGALADTEPELAASPSRLTATFGFGPRVMRELVARGPSLEELPAFRTDRLDPAWGQTDLVMQICADDPLSVAHARRMLLKDAAGFGVVRWIQDGFRRARGSEPAGTTSRNLMGQVDGTVNPDPARPDFAPLVWTGPDSGMVGGSFLVVRRIRMLLDTWDRLDRADREAVIGRRIDTGAPLTGTSEYDEPDLSATDRFGFPVIDPASHLRRARGDTAGPTMLRRPFSYLVPDPDQPLGEDAGLVFLAYVADVDRQFVPVQRRLAEQDLLNKWATTIGSAVYAVPPGTADSGDYVGRSLLEPTGPEAEG